MKAKGFTIIEVMLVANIIGILVAISIPLYINFSLRAKISEGIVVARPAILAVDEFYRINGLFPTDNSQAGIQPPDYYQSRIVEKVEVLPAGNVRITYSEPAILDKSITYTATPVNENIRWTCTTDLPSTFRPSSCL